VQSDSQDKPTVGATFAMARDAMGISPIEAADLLNLTQRTIEALEADDYESLPSRVYVNGYVRAYAKMLGLDADDLVLRSAELHDDSDDAPINDEAKEPASRHYVNKMPISLTLKQWGLVAAGLVGLVLFISFFDDIPRPNNQPVDTVRSVAEAGSSEAMGATRSPVSRPEPDQPEPDVPSLAAAPDELMGGENLDLAITNDEVAEQVPPNPGLERVEGSGDSETKPADMAGLSISEDPSAMLDAASVTAELSEVSNAESFGSPGLATETAPAADPEAAVTESSVAVVAEEPAAPEYKVPYFGEDESGARKLSLTGDEQLRFEFAADCWIEIRGADDGLLYADLGRAGQVRRFVGVAPFKLKIGFAEGVKLFFDAQEVDLAPHTRNQMARLELGQ
jgi:cytoskeleton protein RodZ